MPAKIFYFQKLISQNFFQFLYHSFCILSSLFLPGIYWPDMKRLGSGMVVTSRNFNKLHFTFNEKVCTITNNFLSHIWKKSRVSLNKKVLGRQKNKKVANDNRGLVMSNYISQPKIKICYYGTNCQGVRAHKKWKSRL